MTSKVVVLVATTSAVGACLLAVWLRKSKCRKRKAKFGREIRSQEFSLRENTYPCNNGSYGATPKQVREVRDRFLEELDQSPDEFMLCKRMIYYEEALLCVADFVGAKMENLFFVENATTGINCVLKSFKFSEGDSIFISNLTYPAVINTAFDVCDSSDKGIKHVKAEFKFPIQSKEDLVQQYIDILESNPSIKVAVIDHITSSTALLMPVQELIQEFHSRGVQVIVDGAHAPGQLEINIEELGADYYVGNLYKWSFAPKTCAFLWIHPKHYKTVKPLVTSHHYQQSLLNQFSFHGTRDDSTYFSAPAGIQFFQSIGGLEEISKYNTWLVDWALDMLCGDWGTQKLSIPRGMRAPFMGMVEIPEGSITMPTVASRSNIERIRADIYNKYNVYFVLSIIQGRMYCRISAQVYNTQNDYLKLRDAFLDMKMTNAKLKL